jgi:hypothetical protein
VSSTLFVAVALKSLRHYLAGITSILLLLSLHEVQRIDEQWGEEVAPIPFSPPSASFTSKTVERISMRIAVFWVVAPCSLVVVYQRFFQNVIIVQEIVLDIRKTPC